MIFEVGKFYQHTTGEQLSVICETNTTLYGNNVLIAESNQSMNFKPLERDESFAVNWHEITKDEWMKNFS